VLDTRTGEPVVSGICVPHSPRWYRDALWVLESGTGSLLRADVRTGDSQTVYEAPGFTRGLAFAENYAFVGFSPGRGNVLRGLPIERKRADTAGICVIDLRSGATVASLLFDDDEAEVFDVQVLPGRRYPDVADSHGRLMNHCFMPRQ
jgi:uncharacterized protein (TIGR03032 family)